MNRRGIFIAGSDMNAGKTTLSLGLVSWLDENLPGRVSFMKPLGQKTMLMDGEAVGEDTFLVKTSLGLDIPLEHAAPFAMSAGMAREFLSEGRPSDIPSVIRRSFRHLRTASDFVVVEGTGHPGVGSVFNMSNADVAALLDIPVLLVLDGGIGRTIDSFALCRSLFDSRGVPVAGVVINRVLTTKLEKVKRYLDPWFESRGIRVFGYIPYVGALAEPSIGMLGRELGFEVTLSCPEGVEGTAEGFISGSGSTSEILRRISENPRRALIISSERQEVIDAIIARRLSGSLEQGPGAMVLCGGSIDTRSHAAGACDSLGIPLYVSARSADDSVSMLNRRVFKVEPGESMKITGIVRTVRENVDIGGIMEVLGSAGAEAGAKGPGPVSKVRSWLSKLFGGGQG